MRHLVGLCATLLLIAPPCFAQHEGHADPGDPHAGHGEHVAPADPHAGHAEHGPPADPHPDPEASMDHSAHGSDAAAGHHAHHNMVLDADGMVMNHNPDTLPRDCPELAGEVDLVIRAGREFAAAEPGLAFGYDRHVWSVPPCTRVNVTLENRDAVRHQWMVHGLPRYLYPMGMFTIEVNGPGSRSASFIVPSASSTYLAHCDVSHHMEKGMKGQLVVGGGDGDLPSVPTLSAPRFADPYPAAWNRRAVALFAVAGVLGLAASLALRRA